jgi:hypothetical protein
MGSLLQHRPRWRTVIALPLLIGLILQVCLILEASAGMRVCRGDPIVWLSNGAKVTMTASIGADASQVKMVTYVVHAPRNVSVNKVVYTGGVLKDKERVNVVFDRASGYQIEVVTTLVSAVAPVTIDASVGKTRRTLTAPSSTKIVFLFP